MSGGLQKAIPAHCGKEKIRPYALLQIDQIPSRPVILVVLFWTFASMGVAITARAPESHPHVTSKLH